jgi:hypothetical protein
MPLRLAAALLCAVLAITAAAFLFAGLSSRDILHIYARSSLMDYFQVLETGPGSNGQKPASNNYFPRVSGAGSVPVSFPVSSNATQIRIYPGYRPTSVAIVRVCLERSFFIDRCIDGAKIAGYIDPGDNGQLRNATISTEGRELIVNGTASEPYFQLSPDLVSVLRPAHDLPLLFCLTFLSLVWSAFLFSFFHSWIVPLFRLWSPAATYVFLAAGVIRAIFFSTHPGGAVSDSLLFENYLHTHLFVLPGIRGIFYPAFLSLFPLRSSYLYLTQMLLGAIGAVVVFSIIRSMNKPSRWDLLWALLATSVPTLLAMELIDFSESMSVFLVLVALLAFRGIQQNGASVLAVSGLGAACTLLYHTKPQFGFLIVVFAITILFTSIRSIRTIAAFCAPVLAMQLVVTHVNASAGNFHGVTSTFGYSLFNHAQQFVSCPSADPEPRIQFFCRARAEMGTKESPTSYTAWVIYPSMHELQELFPQTTAGYASLSLHLISGHPVSYAGSVVRSFLKFWIDDVPMVAGIVDGPDRNVILSVDRYLRRAIEFAFFLSLTGLFIPGLGNDRDRRVFCLITLLTIFGSATVQALAESGNEQARFAVPTMPLLLVVTTYLAGILLDRFYTRVGSGTVLVKKLGQ